ncbi:MAG: TetR/AcrR family transcriptional regulator, partial [Acidobacteria bacterium]|nr:TetR/AcrR family transcriptional regulator [Acidobacteriota bacterium]
ARETILQAAMSLFARKGYAGTSTREICESAGVTKPVLYYYFHDKQHLYRELMIDAFGYYRKLLLRAARSGGKLRDRLIRIIHEDFRSAREDPERVRFLLRMILAPEEDLPYFNYVEEFDQERALISGVLQEGIDAGEIRCDPRLVAASLMSMELFAILENLLAGRPTLTRKHASRLVDVVLQGCRPG